MLAGFLKLLGPDFLSAIPYRVINTHNALLPSFPGVHGPADALAYGVKITGATLFVVDPGVDTGAILSQVTCTILDGGEDEFASLEIKVSAQAPSWSMEVEFSALRRRRIGSSRAGFGA